MLSHDLARLLLARRVIYDSENDAVVIRAGLVAVGEPS